MRKFIKEYLMFSRSEKNALIILAMFFILIVVLNIFLPHIVTPERNPDQDQLAEIKRIQAILNDSASKSKSNSAKFNNYDRAGIQDAETISNQGAIALFVFDPNIISAEDMQKLNIPLKVVNNIIKFRQKGGKFNKPDDLRKIYGMTEEQYEMLEPYIEINQVKNANHKTEYQKIEKDQYIKQLELNTATIDDLDKLPAIGISYANRIIKYRQLLGGYCRKEQLLEVYGLDSAVYNRVREHLTVDDSRIIKIALNLADINILGRHPYIGYKLANLIIDHRNRKGPYKSIQELTEVIGSESYIKLSPYLKLWD
jgi:competence ComEA-like helix-hairpin-helix protein